MPKREEKKEHTCRTYLRLLFEGDGEELEKALFRFTDNWQRRRNGEYAIAPDDCYDVDVNNMIRRTIAPFLGKEDKLKEFIRAFNACMYLEIVPCIVRDSSSPAPILSFDGDVIAFLYKSEVKPDIDYYII